MDEPKITDPRRLHTDETLDPKKLLFLTSVATMPFSWTTVDGEQRTSVALRLGGVIDRPDGEEESIAITVAIPLHGVGEVVVALTEEAMDLPAPERLTFIQNLFAVLGADAGVR